VPFVKQLSQELIAFAKENKLLFTLHDRFCRFNKWETTNKEWNPETNRFNEVPLYTKEQAMEAFKAEMLDKYKENLQSFEQIDTGVSCGYDKEGNGRST